MIDNAPSARTEWKSNWTLVLASSVGFSFFSILLAASGVFMAPLEHDFGWKRDLLGAGPSVATFITAVLSPFFGWSIDRLGSRRIVLPGLVITMVSISAFSLANGSWTQWLILWAVFGVVSGTIKSTAWTAAVVGVFKESRGLALGLVLSGTAVAQMIVPWLSNTLITHFGWRASFVWLSLGWGGVTLLLCVFFLFDARDDAARRLKAGKAAIAKVDLPGLSPKEALMDWALWRVAISNFVVMVMTIGLTIHLFPILTDAGVSRNTASLLVGLAGAAGIAGKLATGVLLDRFPPNWVGGITLGAAAITFLLLIDGIRSLPLVVVAMVINGYAFGTKTQITGFLTASYGGMKNFGLIYSVMAALMAVGSSLGPYVAGLIYVQFGGYGPFLMAGAVGCALGGFLMITMPAYPKWDEQVQAKESGEAVA